VNTKGDEQRELLRHGITPLCRAAYFNANEVMELLLKHGAEVNSASGDESALIYASFTGNLKGVQMLVEHGASINHAFGPHQTPLNVAITSGHVQVAKYLFSHGGALGPGDVYYAAMTESPELVELALSSKPDQQQLNSALATAAGNQRADEAQRQLMLASLLAHGADPDAPQNGLPNGVLENAITAETAAFLLGHGANARLKLTGYDLAAGFVCTGGSRDHLALLRMLVAAGLDFRTPRIAAKNPIGCAAEREQLALIDFLVGHGADVHWPDADGRMPIFHARTRDVIEALMKYGADLNQTAARHLEDGSLKPIPQLTALSESVNYGQWDKVALLLSMGANVNEQGAQFLAVAAVGAPADIVTALLDRGVDVNAGNTLNETALMAVVRASRGDKIEILLDHGADVNARNRMGKTALHLAVEAGNTEMVKVLLAHGADRAVADGQGITPVAEARAVDLRLLLAGGTNVPDVEGPSSRDMADCAAALVRSGGAPVNGDGQQSPQLREPGEDWDFLDQIADDPTVIVIEGRRYLFARSNDDGYLARIDADGIERIVCEYGKSNAARGRLKSFTEYERLKARATRDFKTVSFESTQLQGVRGAEAILEASRLSRDPVPLQFNSDTNLLGDAAEFHRDDLLAYYLNHGVDANLQWIEHPQVQSSSSHDSALFVAVKAGSETAVQLLLEHGADPDVAGDSFRSDLPGTPALAEAVLHRGPSVVEALLAHGARPDFPSPHVKSDRTGLYASFYQFLGSGIQQWVSDWLYKPRYEGSELVANAAVMFRHGASPDPWLYAVMWELQFRANTNNLQLPEAIKAPVKTAPESEQVHRVADGVRTRYPPIAELLDLAIRYRDAPPCDASTALGDLPYCLPRSLRLANQALDARYKALLENSGTDVVAVRKAQRTWLRERDKDCAAKELTVATEDGWLAYVLSDSARAQCVLQHTLSRTAALPPVGG
jgi:ankyrin repeat protein/uncharacterized protein YecT (DUF1311 family)